MNIWETTQDESHRIREVEEINPFTRKTTCPFPIHFAVMTKKLPDALMPMATDSF